MVSQSALGQFIRYAVVGSIVFCIDVGGFQFLVTRHALLPVAVIVSYAVGLVVNFSLNRYWNFRVFDRSLKRQLRTYLVINGAILLMTLIIVEAGVHAMGMLPLEAKIIAVAFNTPFGFVAHKYLTFGPGIVASMQQLRSLLGRPPKEVLR